VITRDASSVAVVRAKVRCEVDERTVLLEVRRTNCTYSDESLVELQEGLSKFIFEYCAKCGIVRERSC
jgi:hypothetical protein